MRVSAGAASGVYSATLTASALISDWTVLAEGAKLWLPMDDPVTADRSGSFPPNDAVCLDLFRDLHLGGGRALRQRAGAGRCELPGVAGRRERDRVWGVALVQDQPGSARALVRRHGTDENGAEIYLSGGKVLRRGAAERRDGGDMQHGTGYADAAWHHVVHVFGGGDRG